MSVYVCVHAPKWWDLSDSNGEKANVWDVGSVNLNASPEL